MRFLLLIALALLPLSTAFKCHKFVEWTGACATAGTCQNEPKAVEACSSFCSFSATDIVGYGRIMTARCDSDGKVCKKASESPCKESSANLEMNDGVSRNHLGKACCCKDDLCNESMAKAKESIKKAEELPLTCMKGVFSKRGDGKIQTDEKVPTQCPAGTRACTSGLAISSTGMLTINHDCAQMGNCGGTDAACGDGQTAEIKGADGSPIKLLTVECCCRGNLCNNKDGRLDGAPMPKPPAGNPANPATAPTALLSLAAAAGVLATRL